MTDNRPQVFLALPAYDGNRSEDSARGAYLWPTQGKLRVYPHPHQHSALAHCFNTLWCEALNLRERVPFTHWAMLHADVGPAMFWLDTLHEEMTKHDADIISAVVAIKDERYLTSTAATPCPGGKIPPRRITTAELAELPETFDVQGLGFGGESLLVNTGCMLIDFKKPWVERFFFQQTYTIRKREDGIFEPVFAPEDWLMSLLAQQTGLRVFATRKVVTVHKGSKDYASDQLGACPVDPEWSTDGGHPIAPTGAWLTAHPDGAAFDRPLADALAAFFHGSSVLDLGCGRGHYVKHLYARGVYCEGVDGNPLTPTFFPGLRVADLTQVSEPLEPGDRFDWALSLEVGEHIPAEHEDAFFWNLHNGNRRGVVLSWAVPGQGGHGHVNERPNDYVRGRMGALGYEEDLDAEWKLRSAATLPYFKNTLMVFRRAS